jgi:SAM-dependent methyltransferase
MQMALESLSWARLTLHGLLTARRRKSSLAVPASVFDVRLRSNFGIPYSDNGAPETMTDKTTEAIRESYDRLADEYARRISNELPYKPLDRQLLDRFAAEVAGRGEVCDMGCGPGHVARYLRDVGAPVFGLDIAPRMVEQAGQLNPDISFREGDMLELDIPDRTLAGIAAFYAIVNIPKKSLPLVFREMERVLRPDGLLLLAFHTGDQALHEEELWGRPISMDFFLFPPLEIQGLLEAAGFAIEEVIEREPYAPEVEYQSRRAYIFARKTVFQERR